MSPRHLALLCLFCAFLPPLPVLAIMPHQVPSERSLANALVSCSWPGNFPGTCATPYDEPFHHTNPLRVWRQYFRLCHQLCDGKRSCGGSGYATPQSKYVAPLNVLFFPSFSDFGCVWQSQVQAKSLLLLYRDDLGCDSSLERLNM